MTKKLVLALLVLALLVPGALFATGSAETGGGKVEAVKLFSSVGAWKALLEKEIADWNASVGKEKGIRIDIETNIDKYSEVLTIALESGNHPDIYYIDGRVDQCVTKGWAKAIEDIKGGKEWLEGYKGMLKPIRHQYEGKTYTVPFEFLPIKLAYNKDLFKKAGIVDARGDGEAAGDVEGDGRGREEDHRSRQRCRVRVRLHLCMGRRVPEAALQGLHPFRRRISGLTTGPGSTTSPPLPRHSSICCR